MFPLACLAKAGVPEKRRRWYVKHIEYFIRAQNGRRIKTLTADDINHYFDVPGRQNQLKSWQFLQRIDAIRILYCELFALFFLQSTLIQHSLADAGYF